MKKKLSLFTTAGYPHIDSLPAHLELFERKGVDFVEVGIPFSDPLADGPTIQDSSTVALKNGMHLGLIFEQLKARKSRIPILLMGYINPVLQFGLDKFLQNAVEVGANGFVLPDLSVELYEERYQTVFDKYGIPICFLVTPSTRNERIIKAAQHSRNGFVYLVSSNSTTGNESSQTADLQARYKEIKTLCGTTSVMIGFGIKDKASFLAKTKNVDGGIIGSAFIKAAGEGKAEEFLNALTPIIHKDKVL
jgi:tryptophan synthase alpha chain